MKLDLMNLIFGMKVRKARTEMNLSLSAFAKECGLSPSYLTEIEKGRKYPKRDKILRIAQVTGREYDELVSIRLDPSLRYLETALSSPLIGEFPLDEFGLEVGNIVEMLTRAPDKVGALVRALIEIGRRYDMKDEHFLRAALRSYQEMHDNHFIEIEAAAEQLTAEYDLAIPPSLDTLREIAETRYNYVIDDDQLAKHEHLSNYRAVVIKGKRPRLLINNALPEGGVKLQIAREIGYHILGLKQRAYTSPPEVAASFEQVLNDFKASYFAGALLIPSRALIADVEHFFGQKTYQQQLLIDMLERYDVTPEVLSYRMSELIPWHFGIDLHFLRFNDLGNDRYRLAKHLNLNQLSLPQGLALHEHHCRRWLTVRLPREMEENGKRIHTGVQISEFMHSGKLFLCFGFGRYLAVNPQMRTSVTLGFEVDENLASIIKWADDPNIGTTLLHDTCERCPLSAEQCQVRAAPPRVHNKVQEKAKRQDALRALHAGIHP